MEAVPPQDLPQPPSTETGAPVADISSPESSAAALLAAAGMPTTDAPSADGATATETEADRRAWAAEATLEDLFAINPRLRDEFHGRTGREAQRLAQQQAQALAAQQAQAYAQAQAEAQQRAYYQVQYERQQEELKKLREEDPYGYVEKVKQIEQQQAGNSAYAQQIQQAMYRAGAHWDQRHLHSMLGLLPEQDAREVYTRLQQGGYSVVGPNGYPDHDAARENYRNDVIARYAQHHANQTVSELEKRHEKEKREALEAQRRELLGISAEAEQSPDTGGSGAAMGMMGVPTPAQWDALGFEGRAEFKRKYPQLVDGMFRQRQ